ncbi:MAG: ribose 5-phosphate isomerase B [Bacteroidales bacterium]
MFDKKKTLALGCDHAGYPMKEAIKAFLLEQNYTIKDFGTDSEESVDYPDFIHPLAHAINDGEIERGIIFCGSGNGVQMTANKYPNVRAGLCWDTTQAHLIREHNNANIMSLPGRFVSIDDAKKMVSEYLETEFAGGKHQRRVEKINQIIK